MPTEHELAKEMGASRQTARRVLQQLLDAGLVVRKPHGRLRVNRRLYRSPRLQLAFLAPAYNSPYYGAWHLAVEQAAARHQASVRAVDYVHWEDPVISESMAAFDGLFLMPSSDLIPRMVIEQLSHARHLVALEEDLTRWRIPSIQLLPPELVARLGDHLYNLGHRHIDCLNTQPDTRPPGAVIRERIAHWEAWRHSHNVQGRLINEPVVSFANPLPKAYTVMKRLLDAGEFRASALLCITGPAATGAIRAFYEHGLRIGQDVSICSIDSEGLTRYQAPSRTVLESPDPSDYLDTCLEWMGRRTQAWKGPLLLRPRDVSLFAGESTGSYAAAAGQNSSSCGPLPVPTGRRSVAQHRGENHEVAKTRRQHKGKSDQA